MNASYCITYNIATEESARDGDYAEHGFVLPGRWDMPIETAELRQDLGVDQVIDGDWYDDQDHGVCREAAEVLISAGLGTFDDNGDGSWYGADAPWSAKTDDGVAGCRSFAVHLAGLSHTQLRIVRWLVASCHPTTELPLSLLATFATRAA